MNTIWTDAPDDDEQDYIIEIHFCSYNSEKVKVTKDGKISSF
jgi:predicted nucleic acid-binding Zn finger protein